MSPVVTTAIAALSAAAAVGTLFVYLYFVRRSDLVAAREEALALAETRRQVIHELRGRLKSNEERQRRAKADSERRIRQLQATLDRTQSQARKDAYQTQHFYAVALSDLSKDLLADLERTPPDVAAAVARIRKLLTAEPHSPRRRSRKLTGPQD
jgi:predicted  nucleic acid-binding Zn-ribbon protein